MRKLTVLILLLLVSFASNLQARDITPVLLSLDGTTLSNEEKEYIKEVNPYGFVFVEHHFKDGADIISLKHTLEELLSRQIYFFADQEGGTVNRLKYIYPEEYFPSAIYWGNLSKENLVLTTERFYRSALKMAILLHALGIDVNLAPTAELRPPSYAGFFITRSYGSDPYLVRTLVDTFARAMKDGGLEPCYKHAPGTGFSGTDPHKDLPIIKDKNFDDLKNYDLIPFTNANRYKYLMVGHALYPKIDKKVISTYNPEVYKFIRRELNFDGFILTDALNMPAAGNEPDGDKIKKSLNAGADIALPFFDKNTSFEYRLEEIKKISPEDIKKFNAKLRSLKQIK